MSNIKTISILGCGWYGFALAKNLISQGYAVNGSSTTPTKLAGFKEAGIKPFNIAFEAVSEAYDSAFFNCQILIVSVPPKRGLGELDSYIEKIQKIKNAIISNKVKQVIFISSTSVYGDHNSEVDEQTSPLPDTPSGKVMLEAENLLKNQKAFALTILRFGGLIGPGRDPARFFAGKKNIPNGKAPVNLLHLDDCIGITNAVINKDAFGNIFNACSNSHPEKMDFYTNAAILSKLEVPQFVPELKEWKIVSSHCAEIVLAYHFKNI